MMNQQPDKLFRDKLESYQRPAPAPAWDRIEAGLEKRHDRALPWMKIAAALLLVALALWVFWPKDAALENTPRTAEHENAKPPAAQTPGEKPSLEKQQAAIIPSEKKNNDKAVIKRKPVQHVEEKQAVPEAGKEKTDQAQMIINDLAMAQQDLAVNEEPSTQEVLVAAADAEEKNIKIVFTANDAEKYLVKNLSDEATTDAKKQSRLQKLLDKAEDLTTNQDPIGEIRQVKNEILALNFRSEKSRGQNK
jgi:hypothetical protein